MDDKIADVAQAAASAVETATEVEVSHAPQETTAAGTVPDTAAAVIAHDAAGDAETAAVESANSAEQSTAAAQEATQSATVADDAADAAIEAAETAVEVLEQVLEQTPTAGGVSEDVMQIPIEGVSNPSGHTDNAGGEGGSRTAASTNGAEARPSDGSEEQTKARPSQRGSAFRRHRRR